MAPRTRMTAIWVCQAFCGCQIEMDAEWVHDPLPQPTGLPHQHAFPVKDSIRRMTLVAACPAHTPWLTEPVPADPYQGQRKGYLTLPDDPSTLTPVEKLFIRLYPFMQKTWWPAIACGCRGSVHGHRDAPDDQWAFADHPQRTLRCRFHADDTDAQKCRTDNQRAVDARKVIAADLQIDEAEVPLRFDADTGEVEFTLPASARSRAATLAGALAATFGAGKFRVR